MDKYSVLDDMLFHYNADTDGDEEGVVIVYKADDVADRVRKLKARYEEAAGDSSLQLFLCEQFMEEILN